MSLSYSRKTVEEAFRELKVGEPGLSSKQAKNRLAEYGRNAMASGPETSSIKDWPLILPVAFTVILVVEIDKAVRRFLIKN